METSYFNLIVTIGLTGEQDDDDDVSVYRAGVKAGVGISVG